MPPRVDFDDRSFRRFLRTAPKEARAIMSAVVQKTAISVGQRMKSTAPVGPDAPHFRDVVDTVQQRKNALTALVGIINNDEQAHIALYNEYEPNKQPTMRAAADHEGNAFRTRMIKGIKELERTLSVGEAD